MSKLSEAADATLAWAGQMQGLLLVAEELKKIGSLENAKAEAEKATLTAREDLAKQREALSSITERATAASRNARADAAIHQEERATALVVVRAQAEEIKAKATADAASIMAAHRNDHDIAVAASNAELLRLSRMVGDQRLELGNLTKHVEGAKSEHAELRNSLDAMRAKARSIAG